MSVTADGGPHQELSRMSLCILHKFSFPIGKMFGYWFPADMPEDIVNTFNQAVEKVTASG